MSIIQDLIRNTDNIAVVFRQILEPVEGKSVAIFPPTYPANKETSKHRMETPYTVNRPLSDGRFAYCDIDSVQSQANRMEMAIATTLGDLLPNHRVEAGSHIVGINELPHRIADAAIRATPLEEEIRKAFLEYSKGNPTLIASLSPLSLLFGAWDSRDTQIKIPRVVRSEIRATQVDVLTRSAQFSGIFTKEDLKLSDEDWKEGANIGFAPTPSVDKHGGVVVHGEIIRTASIHLGALRKYSLNAEDLLPCYLLGLAMAGVMESAKDYNLRSGCWLVPTPTSESNWTKVRTDGLRELIMLDGKKLVKETREVAENWSRKTGISLGGETISHIVDPERTNNMLHPSDKKKQTRSG
ncbi:MAG: type I-U CRISPR-associated protein Cas7, partial [Magnetococcales bacterium]|nr:type I-U CRISPR-associated protein Cas7 [Magnetococcales bacterium]